MGPSSEVKAENITFYVIDKDGKPGEPIGFGDEAFVTVSEGDGFKACTHTFAPIDIYRDSVELSITLSKKSARKLKRLIRRKEIKALRRVEIKERLRKIFNKKGHKYYGKDC